MSSAGRRASIYPGSSLFIATLREEHDLPLRVIREVPQLRLLPWRPCMLSFLPRVRNMSAHPHPASLCTSRKHSHHHSNTVGWYFRKCEAQHHHQAEEVLRLLLLGSSEIQHLAGREGNQGGLDSLRPGASPGMIRLMVPGDQR